MPPIFALIQKIGAVAQVEMDRTFNNGLGMILVVGKKQVAGVTQTLEKMGEKYFLIGEIRNGMRGATIRS